MSPEPRAKAIERAVLHIEALHLRNECFPQVRFADPSWNILLVLYLAELERRQISFGQMASEAEQSETTSHRHFDRLAAFDLVSKRRDRQDLRRQFVALTPKGSNGMKRWAAADS